MTTVNDSERNERTSGTITLVHMYEAQYMQ